MALNRTLSEDKAKHCFARVREKWAQAKFLRQEWMKNNLPKLFHDIKSTSFILD